MAGDDEPEARPQHRSDALGTRFVEKTGDIQEKAKQRAPGKLAEKDSGPPGGFDDTTIPRAPPGYTIGLTFHKAENLPLADINSLSSDPYIVVQVKTALAKRHKQDPDLTLRTQTIRRDVNPQWNCNWIIANVPASGFYLKARIYDEDPADHDDRLGNISFNVSNISDGWSGFQQQSYDIRKRMGSKRAYLIRGCAVLLKQDRHMSGHLTVSAELLGRTENTNGGHMYTVGPCSWTQHLSPLIGRLAGTKDPKEADDKRQAESYNFQANQLQLAGPVPAELYHRYVEFKPFVAGMFTSHSLRGRILNRALHHQHARIYNYDRSTVYGSFPFPSKAMTQKFLELVHHGQGGRMFTYVITLDGQWRFTETGKQFGIDLLSKHTMHSDVSIYIAFSGEFFVRRLKHPWRGHNEQEPHLLPDFNGGPSEGKPPTDPSHYQLIIDNDSGTYRPNAKLLFQLKEFMQRNLPGLNIMTLDCKSDAEKMNHMKEQQRERRKAEGDDHAYVQRDSDSVSSSDIEDLDTAAGQAKKRGKLAQLGHDVKEPKDTILNWAQGGKTEREERKIEDDVAAAGPSTAGHS